MANNYPYEQWYWEDWFTDTSFLSPMAKYVWFQVLGVMWTKGRLATLTQRDDEFCRFLGVEKSVFDEAVTELSRDCHGRVTRSDGFTTFYSKRRDNDNRERCLSTERKRNERANKKSVTELSRDCHANVTGHTRAYIQSHSHSHSHNQMSLPAGEPMGAPACVNQSARSVQGQSLSLPRTPKDVKDAAALSGKLMSEEQATSFFEYYEARGWVIPNSGPVVRWQSLIDGWMRREKQRGYSNANDSRALEPRASACGDPRNTAADFDDFPC